MLNLKVFFYKTTSMVLNFRFWKVMRRSIEISGWSFGSLRCQTRRNLGYQFASVFIWRGPLLSLYEKGSKKLNLTQFLRIEL